MITVLRFLGVANAAVWFGAAVFFTFFAGPAFFSSDMKALLGVNSYPVYSGAIAQIVIARYFLLHYICGGTALALLWAEWLYSGKKIERFTMILLGGLLAISLAGGLWLQPKLKQLHLSRHAVESTAEQRTQAASSFKIWHAASQIGNLALLLGLVPYLWQASYPSSAPRFFSAARQK